MGPRFFNRGNVPLRQATPWTFRLQWGRGFSTAEMRARSIHPADHVVPSMGPRFFNRGNACSTLRLRRDAGCPSMGPRFFNRGNHQLRHSELRSRQLPSMGPRFFNRGNSLRLQARDAKTQPSMGPRFFNRGNPLVLAQSSAAIATAFNGAAVFQPRKSDHTAGH